MNLTELGDESLILYHQMYKEMMRSSKRAERVKMHGFDRKFAYHVVRLLDEVEQILVDGDIDLRRNREHLKAIRKGEVSEEDIRKWASDKEHQLEKVYAESKLQHSPDQAKIQQLLENCLEEHYGSLAACVVHEDAPIRALREIQEVLDRNASLFA